MTPQKPVVIFMEKSCLTLAAMLGVVYAGCFCVCVNPEQPPKRIGKIFEVLKPAVVLTIDEHREILEEAGYEGITVSHRAVIDFNGTRWKGNKEKYKERKGEAIK